MPDSKPALSWRGPAYSNNQTDRLRHALPFSRSLTENSFTKRRRILSFAPTVGLSRAAPNASLNDELEINVCKQQFLAMNLIMWFKEQLVRATTVYVGMKMCKPVPK